MRIAKWDNLKFVLIYFVVLGHMIGAMKCDSSFLRGTQFFIYTFHMPAFLFIAGLFSKRTVDYRKYDKIASYLFLYFFMKVFRFLISIIINGKPGGFDFFTEGGVPWFGLTLFLCYLVTVFFSRFNHIYILVVAVLAGIFAGYTSNLDGFLTGMRLFTFYPFFWAGYCTPIDKITEFTEKRLVKVSAAVILLVTLIVSYAFESQLYKRLGFFKGKSSYATLKISQYGGIYRGIYYILAMLLIICIIAIIPSVNCIFTSWGGRTLQVFAIHYPILSLLLKCFDLEERLSALWPGKYAYLLPVIALVYTIILSTRLLEPFFKKLMNPGAVKGNGYISRKKEDKFS